MSDNGFHRERSRRTPSHAELGADVERAVQALVEALCRAIQNNVAPGRRSSKTGINIVDQPLLTVRDVAQMLKIPTQTIYTWRYEGIGPPGFKVGRHLRFKRDDVERWLNERASESR